MKLSLALSGGGSRGAFELGVLQYLDENNIEIQNLSGSSIGSIISASYASGVKPKRIFEIFKSPEIQKLIKFNYFNKGIFTVNTKAKILDELFPIKNLEDIPKKVFICVYDIKAKKLEYLHKGDVKKACLASSALVPVFSAIRYDNKLLIDGGLVDNLPVTPLLDFENKILSIDLFPRQKFPNSKKTFTLNPIKIFKRKFFKQWHKNQEFAISKSDYYITNMKLREYKILTFKNLDSGFELGYNSCKEYFEKTILN